MKPERSWKHLVAVAALVLGLPFAAEAGPTISGNIRTAECQDAFRIANWSYHSRGSRLRAMGTLPKDIGSEMVLGALERDISGGNALEVDEKVLERLPYYIRGLYWERSAMNAERLVVQEMAASWQGDRYSVYGLPATTERDDLASDDGTNYEVTGVTPLLDESWSPPLVLRRSDTKRLWFITMGEPYEVLADWRVYRHTPDGYREECKVVFSDLHEGEIKSLPRSVQTLVRLLDETLGSGDNEGSLRPTVRIRLAVGHFWANAALRPWAVTDRDRYNSKSEVDDGLEGWSTYGPSYKTVYRKIRSTYPAAQKDLARYYQRTFKLSRRGAETLAQWILEIGYCANYTFSAGDENWFRYDDVDTNPWSAVQGK